LEIKKHKFGGVK